jgi:DNA-binding transcriptional LysR family regulator
MELTEGGAIALPWAQGVLASYDNVIDDLTLLSKRPAGVIRLAANHYVAEYYLPSLLAEFCRLYPDIPISISTADNQVDPLAGRYDVAVHSGCIPDSGLVGIRIAEFRNILCASPRYLQSRGIPRHPDELVHHDCLTHAATRSAKWSFRKNHELIAHPIRELVEADNDSVLLGLARNGMGIACLPEYMLR